MSVYTEPRKSIINHKLAWLKSDGRINRGCSEEGQVYPPSEMEFPYVILCNRKSGKTICIPVRKLSAEERSIRRLRRKIISYVREDNRFKAFWTLTYSKLSDFPGNSSQLRKLFNRIQIFRKRNRKPPIIYCWKYEEGSKSSRPHFHVLVEGYLQREDLERFWPYGMVYQQGIKTQAHMMSYIFKYFSKEQHYPVFWKYGKRFSSSRSMPKSPKSEWTRVGWSKDPLDLTQDYWKSGPIGKYL